MKPSNYFKTMDEVQKFCESFRNQCSEEEYKVLLKVMGLAEQEGIYQTLPDIGQIDFSIADYVAELNLQGLKTIASCSGLLKDHPDWQEPAAGYISFLHTPKTLEIIKAATTRLNLNFEESEAYLQPSLYIRFAGSEETKEYLWKVFVDTVLKELAKKA